MKINSSKHNGKTIGTFLNQLNKYLQNHPINSKKKQTPNSIKSPVSNTYITNY